MNEGRIKVGLQKCAHFQNYSCLGNPKYYRLQKCAHFQNYSCLGNPKYYLIFMVRICVSIHLTMLLLQALSHCLEECLSLIHHLSVLPKQPAITETTTTTTTTNAATNVLLSNGQSNNSKTVATTDHNNFHTTSTVIEKQSLV